MLTIAGNVVKYLRYWKTALKNRAFRCCFQREGDGESPSANLSAASLERPRESAAGASRYRSTEMCAGTIRVVPRLTSPLSQGRGFIFVGADAHIGPAGWAAFTELFGKVVAASRADVGIGPYNETGGCLRICYEGPKAACCAGGQSRPFGKMALSPLPDSLVQ